MGTSGRPSISKRQKEQARAEKQRAKAAKREQRKLERQNAPDTPAEGVASEPGTDEAPPPDARPRDIEPTGS